MRSAPSRPARSSSIHSRMRVKRSSRGSSSSGRERHPFGSDYSWWDYRMNGFRNNHGFRIDHVLVTPPLAALWTAAHTSSLSGA